jgi:hypothetical protein
MHRTTRSLLVAAAGAGLTLTASPALAHGGEDSGFEPLPPEFYEQAVEVEACGDTVLIESGDVREVETRETERPDGSLLVEFRGEATLDLTRLSDGAMIDELDVGGPGFDVVSPDGSLITSTLFGESIIFPVEPVQRESQAEAGLPTLAYFEEGSATVEIQINPETGEVIDEEWTDIDARIIDLCEWFDHGTDRDDHRGDAHVADHREHDERTA